MANFYDFSSDNINIIIFIIDKSGSMENDEDNVREGLSAYKKSFENFPEANSIAISVCKFNGVFEPGDFQKVTKFDTSYSAWGGTALYYSILQGEQHLNNYVEEVTRRTGCIPRVTFILLSDGEAGDRSVTWEDAKDAIERLNLAGVTTAFIAFGSAIESEFGKNLGFMATIDVKDRETLVNFLGVELSKSCKEQSKSLKALGANFFSKAVDSSKSEGYSQTTKQALDDDEWFNDIDI